MARAILSVNAGSSSLKFAVYPVQGTGIGEAWLTGAFEGLEPQGQARMRWTQNGQSSEQALDAASSDPFDIALQRLQALLDSLQRAGEADRLQRSGELDLCLAELSGNRALALFVRLLGALAESYPSGAVAQWILQHLGEHQARLGAAVLAGDPSLARRRMLDQLRLIETGFGLAED